MGRPRAFPDGRAGAGTASAVRDLDTAAADLPPAPAPQAPVAPARRGGASDRLAQLKQLGELLTAGQLTKAEFEQEKARILNG